MNRIVGYCTLLIAFGTQSGLARAAAGAQEVPPGDSQRTATPPIAPTKLTPLAVVGFRADQTLDDRDTWLPLAVEETLAWRLRRLPGVTVMPTIRIHQSRKELAEKAGDPPVEWPRVLRLAGAKQWLRGTCAGTPDALVVNLELLGVGDGEAKLEEARLGPGRLFDVIDQATHWITSRFEIGRIDANIEKLVFDPPASSPSALEYYARALAAARDNNLRDAAYYAEQVLDYDAAFRPALLLLAKIGLHGSPAMRDRASFYLRSIKQLAAAAGDAIDEAEFEINQGLLLTMERSFDPARRRFESAMANAFERDDPYGQIAAMNSLCDLWCGWLPPRDSVLSEDARRRLRAQNLRRASEWQLLALEIMQELGDVVGQTPAANKLALIYEQLDEPEAALEMHKRTVAAATSTGSARNQATAWLFLGQWYRRNERWDEALDATNRCLALVPDDARPAVRITLAEIYRGMSLPRDALGHYESAYEVVKTTDDLISQFRCLRGIAELRMELGERDVAVRTLQEALDIAEVLELPEEGDVKAQLEGWRSATPQP